MRYYLSSDIEGMSGFTGGRDEARWQAVQKAHMLAAFEALHEAGASHVRAKSFHGMPEGLPDYVEHAKGVPGEFDLPQLSGSFDGFMMLGFHGLEPEAAFGHSYRFPNLILNGKKVGEIAIQVMLAAQKGVPLVFFAGDRFAVDEALMYAPEALTVTEREGVEADEGEMNPEVLDRIRETVGEAVRRTAEIPVPELPERYVLGVPFRTDLEADFAEDLPYPVSRNGRVVVRESADYADVYTFLLDSFQCCNKAMAAEKEGG